MKDCAYIKLVSSPGCQTIKVKRKLKSFFSIIFIIFITRISYSQPSGTIEGTALDSANNSPLSGASVSVLNVSDSKVVTGASAGDDGSFIISNVPYGQYKIEITYIGYNTKVIAGVNLSAQNSSVKLGKIFLGTSSTSTEEIDVHGQKSTIEFKSDRRVLNVGQDLTLKGANALDVLKNVPGVTVDIDGNVSVRGSEGVKIMIDGKPFGLEGANRTNILEQLNADEIDKVELITNPSIKFDAEGSSGIINIILKKKKDFGYNGSLSVNAGTTDKYSGGLNLNYRKNDLNLTGSYNYNKFDFLGDRSSERISFSQSGDNTLNQDGSGLRRRESHNVKGGLDYSISRFSKIGINVSYRDGTGKNNQTIQSIESNDGAIISDSYRKSFENSAGNETNVDLSFDQSFKNNPDHKLTADFSFSSNPDSDYTNYFDEYVIPTNPEPNNVLENEIEKDKSYQFNTDYVLPFSKKTKFETGYKGTLKRWDDDYSNSYLDYSTNQYVLNALLTNRFKYDEWVNGIYAAFSSEEAGFNYMVGGRLEQTDTKGDLVTTGQNFTKSYLEFFPSISISRKLGDAQELQASYSKRIARPRAGFLNPFLETDDRYNLSIGNPNLNPEFTNSFELNYINYLNIGTVTPSIFFRRSTDQITRVRKLLDSITTLTTFENANSSNSYGAELMFSAQPSNALNVIGTISYYRTDITGGNLTQGETNSAYSWSSRLSSSLNLPWETALQVSYMYNGKRVSAQGTFNPMHTLDVALKKDFFDDNLTITLRGGDLLNTSKMSYNVNDVDFVESGTRRRDSRSILLNLNYKFGTPDKGKKKNKKGDDTKNRDDDSNDMGY